MVRKLSVWFFVTVLLVIEANAFSLADLYSSEELDVDFDVDLDVDLDVDIESPIDDADYWNLLSDASNTIDWDERASAEDEKWLEIDNLDISDVDDDVDDEIVEITPFSGVNGGRFYHFGRRVRGDNVIGFDAKNRTWTRAQDVRVNITYPAAGVVGRKLTFIGIEVNQTSITGKAYIVRGGVGKHFVTIILEAYHILYFNFRVTFYGL